MKHLSKLVKKPEWSYTIYPASTGPLVKWEDDTKDDIIYRVENLFEILIAQGLNSWLVIKLPMSSMKDSGELMVPIFSESLSFVKMTQVGDSIMGIIPKNRDEFQMIPFSEEDLEMTNLSKNSVILVENGILFPVPKYIWDNPKSFTEFFYVPLDKVYCIYDAGTHFTSKDHKFINEVELIFGRLEEEVDLANTLGLNIEIEKKLYPNDQLIETSEIPFDSPSSYQMVKRYMTSYNGEIWWVTNNQSIQIDMYTQESGTVRVIIPQRLRKVETKVSTATGILFDPDSEYLNGLKSTLFLHVCSITWAGIVMEPEEVEYHEEQRRRLSEVGFNDNQYTIESIGDGEYKIMINISLSAISAMRVVNHRKVLLHV